MTDAILITLKSLPGNAAALAEVAAEAAATEAVTESAPAPKATPKKRVLTALMPDRSRVTRKTHRDYSFAVAIQQPDGWKVLSWHGTLNLAEKAAQKRRSYCFPEDLSIRTVLVA